MANKGFFGKTVKLVDNPAISIHMRNRKKNNFVPPKNYVMLFKNSRNNRNVIYGTFLGNSVIIIEWKIR